MIGDLREISSGGESGRVERDHNVFGWGPAQLHIALRAKTPARTAGCFLPNPGKNLDGARNSERNPASSSIPSDW